MVQGRSQTKGQPHGEVYPCCKHCEGQNCDPANTHLAPCAFGCNRTRRGHYSLDTLAEASEVEAETPILSVRHENTKTVDDLMWEAFRERGRRFW